MENPEEMRRLSAAANAAPRLSAREMAVNSLRTRMSQKLDEAIRTAAVQGETKARVDLERQRRTRLKGGRPEFEGRWEMKYTDPTWAEYEMEAARILRGEYETAGYRADIAFREESYTVPGSFELGQGRHATELDYETEGYYLEVDWGQAQQ